MPAPDWGGRIPARRPRPSRGHRTPRSDGTGPARPARAAQGPPPEAAQGAGAYLLDVLGRRGVTEHREATEQGLLDRLEQPMAPLESQPEGALTHRLVDRPTCEDAVGVWEP